MAPKKQSTKERILDAACRLFSERGYHDTTTQMVCEAADANIAAVHYHFQSKDNLYRTVWAHLDGIVRQRWHDRVVSIEDPEDQLREFIKLRVECVLSEGPEGWFPRLLHWEMSNPTPLHEEVRDAHLHEKMQWFMGLVHKILGEKATPEIVHLAGFCIHSPLIHLLEMRTKPRPPKPPAGRPPRKHPGDDPEALVGMMTTFALAGLHELAARYTPENG